MRRPPLRLPDGLPGETVLVNIFNPIENRRNGGKVRPAVLLREISGHYRTVGLTSNPKFGDGQPRRPVPNPKLIGLAGPGYIWGFPTSVSKLDVYRHIGWADPELAEAIIEVSQLRDEEAGLLREAARRHHPS